MTETKPSLKQPQKLAVEPEREWTHGLCSCFEDMKICLCGACLTCILTAYIAESLDEHWFLALLFPTCVPLALLTKLRAVLRIDGDMCIDVLLTECCLPCVLCRMARELKVHGAFPF